MNVIYMLEYIQVKKIKLKTNIFVNKTFYFLCNFQNYYFKQILIQNRKFNFDIF